MPEPYGIYEGTLGEREYAHGRDEGRAAGEYDGDNYPATVWNEIEDKRALAEDGGYPRTRAYFLGWLRGYREMVR